MPRTETQVLEIAFEQWELAKEIRRLPLLVINSLMHKSQDGSLKRPTTKDTLLDLLKILPSEPCSVLFISSVPMITYHDAVIKTYIPLEHSIETVGPQASEITTISDYLDTIARWLYQENELRTKLTIN